MARTYQFNCTCVNIYYLQFCLFQKYYFIICMYLSKRDIILHTWAFIYSGTCSVWYIQTHFQSNCWRDLHFLMFPHWDLDHECLWREEVKLICSSISCFLNSKLWQLGVTNWIERPKSNLDSDIVVPFWIPRMNSDNKFEQQYWFQYKFLI